MLNREQVIDILRYAGSSKIISKEGKDDIQFCCTVHGESNPSAGYSLDKQIFHCFSCHASGDMAWLLFKSLPNEFNSPREAGEWISGRYDVNFKSFDNKDTDHFALYEEAQNVPDEEERIVLPDYKLAPYHSGKSTYKYFFKRGFTTRTMHERKIGYDTDNRTVTIPLFWEDGSLAGIIGRYIDPDRPKNMRYKIYNLNTGKVLAGLQNINTKNKTCILVEGLLDELWLWQNGFENVLATLTNNISKAQFKILGKYFDNIIDFSDNDEMGKRFTATLLKYGSDKFNIYTVKHLYPENCKDPQECDLEDLQYMLKHKKSLNGFTKRKMIPYS